MPAAFFLPQRYAGLRLKEMGELASGFEYPAVHAAIARFEKRLKIDRELQKKIKKEVRLHLSQLNLPAVSSLRCCYKN